MNPPCAKCGKKPATGKDRDCWGCVQARPIPGVAVPERLRRSLYEMYVDSVERETRREEA